MNAKLIKRVKLEEANIVFGPYSTESIINIYMRLCRQSLLVSNSVFSKIKMLKIKGLLRVINYTQGKTDGKNE